MDWKKETENELREYEKKQNALVNIPEILKQIEYELSLIKGNKLNHNLIGNAKKEDMLIDYIIKKNELVRNLSLTRNRIDLIERGLFGVSNDERRILEYFYINRPADYIQTLCQEFGYEKSSLYYKKDRALRNFTLAMYEEKVI